jgi:hypothetical protein
VLQVRLETWERKRVGPSTLPLLRTGLSWCLRVGVGYATGMACRVSGAVVLITVLVVSGVGRVLVRMTLALGMVRTTRLGGCMAQSYDWQEEYRCDQEEEGYLLRVSSPPVGRECPRDASGLGIRHLSHQAWGERITQQF